MRHNSFGEPQPGSTREITEAMHEVGLNPAYAHAEIHAHFWGWTAKITDFDTGEPRIHTVGFQKKSALLQALAATGIASATDDDGEPVVLPEGR